MGVVSFSSSAARSLFGLSTRFPVHISSPKRPLILAFETDKTKNTPFVVPNESVTLLLETSSKEKPRRKSRVIKPLDRVQAVSTDTSSSTVELDYNEAAAKLENIYKLSPGTEVYQAEDMDQQVKRGRSRRKILDGSDENADLVKTTKYLVKSQRKKAKRLSLDKRIAVKNAKEGEVIVSTPKRKHIENYKYGAIDVLVRDYPVTMDFASLDWKKMKIPPVLSSSEHVWLFKLMQPMKAILLVKDNLTIDLGRDPTDAELADAVNMDVIHLRRDLEVGHAARHKLIKHNLRLVLFVMNKYFQDFANGPRFQDLCQAGVKGLITAIDRFETKRKFRLSTYGVFWIRHAIIRSMTLSSFTKVSFGLESVRVEIQKAKLKLLFELKRMPTEEEIIKRVGISPERYQEVMKASKPIFSLHSRHATTQEELINGIADVDGVEGDKRRQSALLRLALDDVLDSLKPKESLVIRQRYGLDGKGDRTLGEIAGNLNISREMVRKHEMKALMKLKHPARVEYLRQYIF